MGSPERIGDHKWEMVRGLLCSSIAHTDGHAKVRLHGVNHRAPYAAVHQCQSWSQRMILKLGTESTSCPARL